MTASANFADLCCGRWAADRARFALYCAEASGAESAWSFWDIQREANRFSNVLAAMGTMRGERVALLLGQRAETAALLVACWQMGAVAVPLSARLAPDELARALTNARVAAVDVAGQAALDGMDAARRPRHVLGVGGAQAAWLREWAALRPLASPRYAMRDDCGESPALLLDAGAATQREFTHAALAGCAEPFRAAHAGYPQPGDLFWSPAEWTGAAGLLEGLLPAWCSGQPTLAWNGGFAPETGCALIGRYDVRNLRLTAEQLEATMAGVPKPNEQYDCRLRTVSVDGTASPAAAAWLAGLGVAGAAAGPA